MAAAFPLEDPAVLDNPFPYFQACRRDSPVLFHPEWNAWFVFGHDDIVTLSRDARLSAQRMDIFKQNAPREAQGQLDFLDTDLRSMVVMLDGDEHHRVRQSLKQGFTPHTIQALEPRIVAHAESLIAGVKGRGACDIGTEVCRQLPLLVLADLFALPGADFPKLQQWAYDFIEYFNRVQVPEPIALALARSGREMMTYTRALIAERRADPGEDLISTLVKAQAEEGGLTDEEIVANVMMVLIAGNDTVGSALGNAMHLVLSHPAQRAKIGCEVGWAEAFEECLRYEPVNPVIMRKVAEGFAFRGCALERGQFVFLALASGSRDENYVRDPEIFDVDRRDVRHLAFGGGTHFCLGSGLARAEAAALLPRLFAEFPELRLDPGRPAEWLRTLGVRGPRTLPVLY